MAKGKESLLPLVDSIKYHERSHDQSSRTTLLLLRAIGDLGIAAESTIPFLDELAGSGSLNVRLAASEAIRRIQEYKACGLSSMPDNAQVYAIGAFDGGRTINTRLSGSRDVLKQQTIIVTNTREPVVLILIAHKSTVWHIGWVPDVNIAGVFISGYEPQFLTGTPNSVPHRIVYRNDRTPCAQNKANWLEPTLDSSYVRIIGLPVTDMIPTSESGETIAGPPLPHKMRKFIKSSSDLTLEDQLKAIGTS